MTITDLPAPLTMRDAALQRRDAKLRLASYDLEYRASRDSNRVAVVARARAQYGLALYEYMQSLIACAKAEDRHNGMEEPAASTATGDREADPPGNLSPAEARERLTLAHGRHDDCWQAYMEARRTGDATAVAAARGEWELALLCWMRARLAHKETEDQAQIAAMQARQDEALKFRPGNPFPRTRSRATTLAEESKERTRRENLQRDRNRYQGN